MKKIGFAIFIAALAVGVTVSGLFGFGRFGRLNNISFGFDGIRGSGSVRSENRPLDGFTGIDVGGSLRVEVTAQKDFSVSVEGDDNLLPLISTEVDDGVLKIRKQERMSPTAPIVIRISAPNIDGLNVSGASNAMLTAIKNDSLTLDVSGASKIKLNGETSRLTIDASGASKIDGMDLAAGDTTIDASGASGVTVNVSGVLKTNASGASSVLYAGTPKDVVSTTSGASKVSRK